MSEVINSRGSIFLNHKTQAVRLKREIRFDIGVKEISLFLKKKGDGCQDIYIVPKIHEEEFLSDFFHSSDSLNNQDDFFDAKVKATIFLNNKTQSARLPMSVRFPEGTKEVSISSVTIKNNVRFLIASNN